MVPILPSNNNLIFSHCLILTIGKTDDLPDTLINKYVELLSEAMIEEKLNLKGNINKIFHL